MIIKRYIMIMMRYIMILVIIIHNDYYLDDHYYQVHVLQSLNKLGLCWLLTGFTLSPESHYYCLTVMISIIIIACP